MKPYLALVSTIAIIFINDVYAIDASNKMARDRPEQMCLANTWSGHSLTVSYTIEGDKPPLNTIHSWTLTVTDKKGEAIDGAEIILSADMPEHLHGMTTRPVITAGTSPGHYKVEGMNFHMPGWWEITLDISKGRSRNLVTFNLLVGEGLDMKHHQHHEHMNMKMDKQKPKTKYLWQGC